MRDVDGDGDPDLVFGNGASFGGGRTNRLYLNDGTGTFTDATASRMPIDNNNTMALAVTDELTGLYNRRYFDRHLNVMLGKALEQDRDIALMILDIDHFKAVNDNHGHDVGDAVLREFAARLRRNIRGVDLACRFGGEEFVVLMPDTDTGQAEAVAERVRQSMAEKPFEVGPSRPLSVTVSAGVALNESHTDTPESLVKRADVALYRAKREGRNRVIFDAA